MLSTSAHLLHGRSAADLSPAYAAPASLIRYTNRPSGHQKRHTKRLVTPALDGGRSLDSCESTHVVRLRRTVGGCVAYRSSSVELAECVLSAGSLQQCLAHRGGSDRLESVASIVVSPSADAGYDGCGR